MVGMSVVMEHKLVSGVPTKSFNEARKTRVGD